MDELVDYEDRLRAVFDVCDDRKEGFISVDHFVNLAKEHFGADGGEEIIGIIHILDPEGTRRINFESFCQGVQQVFDLQGSQEEERHRRLSTLGSEETLVADDDANSSGTHETSELSTYNEYDMMTDDDNATLAHNDFNTLDASSHHAALELLQVPHLHNSSFHSSGEDDRDSAISAKSDPTDSRREQEITDDDEERFEDYGEGEELDSDSQQSSEKSGQGSKSTPTRRVTSNLLASQLYHRTGVASGSGSRRSSCSDEIFDDIDGNFLELNDKVKKLETQIGFLSETQLKNDDRHVKLKEENVMLVERVHMLEEQLREVELKSHERVAEEQKKHRDYMSRQEKDKTREIEVLTQSLTHIEREYQALKEEAPRLRLEVDRLRKDKDHLEKELSECQYVLANTRDEHDQLQERTKSQREEQDQERDINAQLLDELSKELEDLRQYKIEHERQKKIRNPTQTEYNTRLMEMERTIQGLKDENRILSETNDELHAQLLNAGIEEGRNLLHTGDAASIASEIEEMSKDEIMELLREQKTINKSLRQYVDSILLKILEKNPNLLEKKK